jgi:hypothetical protein
MKHPGKFLKAIPKRRHIAIEWVRVEAAQSISDIGSERLHRFGFYGCWTAGRSTVRLALAVRDVARRLSAPLFEGLASNFNMGRSSHAPPG